MSKPLIVTISALVIAGIAAIFIVPSIGKAPEVPLNLARSVSTNMVSLTPATEASGTVQLSFPVGGRVGAVNVTVGSVVQKGDTLATLDTAVAKSSVAQAQAALQLAEAQYASTNLQYTNAKTQQDTLVANAYHTLLSSGLQARPIGTVEELHNPTISGTFMCNVEGNYDISTYTSGTPSGYSFQYSGIENGIGVVTYGTPQPLGKCGLMITFTQGFGGATKWTVDIPNTNSTSYQANLNAYNLAVATRQQTLSQLSASLGQDSNAPGAATASASVAVARAAYEAALAAYGNQIITAPAAGMITFIDPLLKAGQSVTANQRVMTLETK